MGLYDDVEQAGGLAAALTRALREVGSALTAEPALDGLCVIVEGNGRSCDVFRAAEERLFMGHCWDRTGAYGDLSSPSLADLGPAVRDWIAGLGPREMAKRHARFKPGRNLETWEQGREIEARWSGLLEGARDSSGHPPLRPLLPFLELASKNSVLSGLFPFLSVFSLGFSRCTVYPYSRDCPVVEPTRTGGFQVRLKSKVLGEGSPEEALRMVLENLPPNTGRAIRGTAEDL